ncbi:hypothetical protein HYH02_013373 [Chlamydomonas schloesseri]|uniref:Uncharacterized protein n=1 Tax=Chlamydomonas schloesseri TaxID=2026947 RepID=A0A835ST53_9CHLO|nr:hypothetical protein HYH02_013373 [Chlamydomonas schloesseri]|eukprot:KAG2431386.1 hypothetical protein HYH02_013373 [Chlamydomonas schloesseri]
MAPAAAEMAQAVGPVGSHTIAKGAGGAAFFDVVFGFPQYQTLITARNSTANGGNAIGDPKQQQQQAEGGGEELVAVGYAAPCVWGGASLEDLPPTWDHVLATARTMLHDPANAPKPTAMSALAVEVSPQHQGGGLSQAVLRHMKAVAKGLRAKGLIAPIRPILKPQYPLVAMEDYITWHVPDPRDPAGPPVVFDPWLRTHIRLGARILKVAKCSALVAAPVADWEAWTRMRFLSSGPYTVPGGLNVVQVDLSTDTAVYAEDNVWVAHVLD